LHKDSPCSANAIFARHWFTTLAETIQENGWLRGRVEVTSLPVGGAAGAKGCCFAGEWFLAVPSDSACPEISWRIIGDLTTPEADRERIRRGVGLPAQRQSYRVFGKQCHPLFCCDLGRIRRFYDQTFSRLAIAHYKEMSGYLSMRFRQILDFPLLANEAAEKKKIFEILRDTEQLLRGMAVRRPQRAT
jgi:hypothetical protein